MACHDKWFRRKTCFNYLRHINKLETFEFQVVYVILLPFHLLNWLITTTQKYTEKEFGVSSIYITSFHLVLLGSRRRRRMPAEFFLVQDDDVTPKRGKWEMFWCNWFNCFICFRGRPQVCVLCATRYMSFQSRIVEGHLGNRTLFPRKTLFLLFVFAVNRKHPAAHAHPRIKCL